MKKILLKSIFLIFLGLFLFSLANAQEISYFKDDFESYNLGNLPVTSNPNDTEKFYYKWGGDIPKVINTEYHSGTKSIVAPSNNFSYIFTTPAVFTTSTKGEISIWVKIQKKSNYPRFMFDLRAYPTAGTIHCGIALNYDKIYYEFYQNNNLRSVEWLNAEYNKWNKYKIKFEVKSDDNLYCKFIYNDTIETDWILSQVNPNFKYIGTIFLGFFNDTYETDWIDDLEVGQKLEIEYRDFNTTGWIDENFFVDILQTIKQFNPPYPNKPYYIVPTSTDIYFKASFINTSLLNLYRPTKLIFYSRASGTENTIDLNLPWLGQGSTSTNINITQLRNFFANDEDILEMKLEIQRRNLMTAGMWVVDTFYFPLPTAPPIFLALKENPEQLLIIQEGRVKPPEREEYLIPLTDCSQAQNLLENVSCEIRNLLIEVFVPKKKSLEMLENQMNILSNKFPFNVFLTIKNFFGDIVNSLKGEAKVKMFNKEVSLSADFYNSIPVISTLYQGMRLLFNLFIVFMFIKVLKWEVEVLIHSIT
jgi:hypothetical protein